MCGILSFFASESGINKNQLDILFTDAEIRGQDGVGVSIIDPEKKQSWNFKTSKSYSKSKNEVLEFCMEHMKLNFILLGICRNAPETESLTDKSNIDNTMQPIIFDDFIYVHNGAISSIDVDKYKKKMKTKIDSEVIGLSYIDNNRQLKETMESIHGGWSLIMYDLKHKRLNTVSSFIPLAHGYVKGFGYIVHSSINSIRKVVEDVKNKPAYFTRMWEDFYVDEERPYNIFSLDIDSGLMTDKEYKHNFIHPVWKQKNDLGDRYLVLASSGIDSTSTIAYLKNKNYPVTAIHFLYNQKSEEAEKVAFLKIVEKLGVDYIVYDLKNIYSTMMESSMLLSNDINVQTGMNVKSTQAWVPNRNGLFMNIALAYAEHLILNNQYSNVYIAGGYPNISEEAIYPDNTGRFVDSLIKNTARYSTLAGAQKRIKWINCMAGLTKTEELLLLKHFGYDYLFEYTVSCDRAKINEFGDVVQCSKNGIPACGSGKLSYWAAKKSNIIDKRKYYEIEDDNYKHYKPDYMNDKKINITYDINDIIKRVEMSLK